MGIWSYLWLEANVVICELAHVRFVNTVGFRAVIDAKTEARDVVHDPENDSLSMQWSGATISYS